MKKIGKIDLLTIEFNKKYHDLINDQIKKVSDLLKFSQIPEIKDYPIIIGGAVFDYCIHCGKFADVSLYGSNHENIVDFSDNFLELNKRFKDFTILGSPECFFSDKHEISDQQNKVCLFIEAGIHDQYMTDFSKFFESFYITFYNRFCSCYFQNINIDATILELKKIITDCINADLSYPTDQYNLWWEKDPKVYRELINYLASLIEKLASGKLNTDEFIERIIETIPPHLQMELNSNKQQGKYLKDLGCNQIYDYRAFYNESFYHNRFDILMTDLKTNQSRLVKNDLKYSSFNGDLGFNIVDKKILKHLNRFAKVKVDTIEFIKDKSGAYQEITIGEYKFSLTKIRPCLIFNNEA